MKRRYYDIYFFRKKQHLSIVELRLDLINQHSCNQ
jgi:hypothetical protein